MPYAGYKIVVVTPAGRKRYLELLFIQILNYKRCGIVDEYQLWKNTTNQADIDYMDGLQTEYPGFVKARTCPVPFNQNMSIYSFFKECVEEKTIYIRFDDDVVLLDTVEAFKSLLDFRIKNIKYFMIYPTILNNAVITNILQKHGLLTLSRLAGYECNDSVGWNDSAFAKELHDFVLAQPDLSNYRFRTQWLLLNNERVSINGLCWIGSDFKKLCDGNVGNDEELELSVEMPKRMGLINCIYGDYCIVHYSFHTQREVLDREEYLEKYRDVVIKNMRNHVIESITSLDTLYALFKPSTGA
jgi:hypothetical protein